MILLTLISSTITGFDARMYSPAGPNAYMLSPACFGDMNGDGIEDVVICAPLGGGAIGSAFKGAVYVYFGKSDPDFSMNLSGQPTGYDLKITGGAEYPGSWPYNCGHFGSYTVLMDIDGDGYDDLVINEPYATSALTSSNEAGLVHTIYGRPSTDFSKRDYAISEIRDALFDGCNEQTYAGMALNLFPGDVNADGYQDMLGYIPISPPLVGLIYGKGPDRYEGQYAMDPSKGATPEAVGFAFINSTSYNGEFNIFDPPTDTPFMVTPLALGDVNGDHEDDIFIRVVNSGYAPGTEDFSSRGNVFLLYGREREEFPLVDDWGVLLPEEADAVFVRNAGEGSPSGANAFGANVAVEDLDGDGIDDIILSDPMSIRGGSMFNGQVFIIKGRASKFSGTVDLNITSNYDSSFYGDALGMFLGSWIFPVDVNNDGRKDLLVSALCQDPVLGYEPAGRVYILDNSMLFSGIKDKPIDDPSIYLAKIDESGDPSPDPTSYNWWLHKTLGADLNADGIKDLLLGEFRGNGDLPANIFAVFNGQTLALTSPNGGETYNYGETHNITWSCAPTGVLSLAAQPIDLYYSTDGGSSYSPIAASLDNTGSYAWTIPSVSSTSVEVKVLARGALGTITTDTSDSLFTIHSSGPAVSVISPNGGETWGTATQRNITWTAAPGAAALKANPISIYLSHDSGTTYPENVASGLANSGSFVWTTPSISENTLRIKVVAEDIYGLTGEDASNSNFSVSEGAAGPPALSDLKSGPSPFTPGGSGGLSASATDSVKIVYNLSTSTDIQIYIFDAAGKLKWKRDYPSGQEGGIVGSNTVEWRGVDQNNKLLPNGTYIIKIVSKGKVLGTDRMIIAK